ncbi:MAG: cell division protein FtsZ [bacterium]
MIELCPEEEQKTQFGACLKVLGVGGAGGNAVNSMIVTADMENIEFIAANTDAQALSQSSAQIKIQLGSKITKGLGAGSDPEIGRRAAEEDLESLMEHIESADILFLTAGLGGGTGSGSLPVIANIAREMGILTIAIVTKPFIFEGKRRMSIANEAIDVIKNSVDTLIVVPNQRLLEIVDEKISMLNAFALSNDILKQAIKGISDIISRSGHINVDFADVRSIMRNMGMAIMGTGRASGQDRAKKAALAAISSPLLENVSIKGARGVLINITGNTDLGLYEINEAASTVYNLVSEDANIILGSVIDTTLENDILVTVIATGFEEEKEASIIKGATITTPDKSFGKVENKQDKPEKHIEQKQTVPSETKPEEFRHTHQEEPIKNQQQEEAYNLKTESEKENLYDLEDLDTPTFLRKKNELQQKYKNPQFQQHKHHFKPKHQFDKKFHDFKNSNQPEHKVDHEQKAHDQDTQAKQNYQAQESKLDEL